MRHDWIFDVLTDLRSYALQNGLPELAEQVDITLRTARRCVAVDRAEGEGEAWGRDHAMSPRRRH